MAADDPSPDSQTGHPAAPLPPGGPSEAKRGAGVVTRHTPEVIRWMLGWVREGGQAVKGLALLCRVVSDVAGGLADGFEAAAKRWGGVAA